MMVSKWSKAVFSIVFVICLVLILNKNPEHQKHLTGILNKKRKFTRLINGVDQDVTVLSEKIQPLKSSKTTKTPATIGPHVNLVTLKSRPELGLHYHPGANIINGNSRYVTIVANRLTQKSSLNYYFNIPISCSAWIQIGYGCFVVIPYFDQDLDEETKKNLDELNKIIPDTVTKWNNGDTGNVVVLYLKSSFQEDIIKLSQVSRLFVSHFIKYSTTPEEYAEKLQNIYILTSDVDLLPLSTKYYYLNSYDWNLLNIIQNHDETKKINIALSCVGALTRTWYKTVPETRYRVFLQKCHGNGRNDLKCRFLT